MIPINKIFQARKALIDIKETFIQFAKFNSYVKCMLWEAKYLSLASNPIYRAVVVPWSLETTSYLNAFEAYEEDSCQVQ